MKSEIFISKDQKDLCVIFGGKIHVAIGGNKKHNTASVMLQELYNIAEVGSKHLEEWNNEKPTVHLVFDNIKSIEIMRKALDEVEKYLKNNQ